MEHKDDLSLLYNALINKGYSPKDLGDENIFRDKMSDSNNRKQLYDYVSARGDFKIGDYNSYEKRLGGVPKYLQRPEEPIGGYIQPQQSVNSHSLQETPDYASLIEAGQKRMQEYSGEVLPTDAVSNSIPSTSAYQPKIENARPVDVGRSIEEKMIDSQVERIGKLSNTSDKNILENYNNRYAMTDEGSILRDSIEKRRMEVNDRLAKDYLASDLYKELSSRYTGKELDAKANEEFNRVYGGRIEEELAPVYNEYRDKMLHRYGDNIQSELTGLAKENTENQVASLKEEVKQGLEAAYGEWSGKQSEYENNHPVLSALSGVRSGSNTRVATPIDDKKFSNWYSAMNLLDESEKMIAEAKKKGSPGALLRGVRDGVFDVDAWTSGITDMIHGSSLKIAAEKSEREETLTPEEEKLLEAAAVNMATNAYFASDLGRSYRAGQTAGVSIPFTLGFLFNPVSGSGNAIAKGILKYGAKRFGLNALKGSVARNGLKMGSRLIGDAVAATAMTTTTGIGKVAAGANERMIGDVKFDFSEDGKIGYAGRENQMGAGEATFKSFASNTLENQSEMFFNAFSGGGKMFGDYVKKIFPGIERLSSSELGVLYNGLKNNTLFREFAERTQFHGLVGEYFEEVYNNIANIPLGESSWKETVDLDNNIDIICGLAPMSVFMGALGAGGFAVENRRIRKNLNRLSEEMTPEQRAMLDNVVEQSKDMGNQDVRNSMKTALLNKGLTDAQKRTHIEYLYNKLQEKAAKAAREKETEDAIQKETDDIVNSSNQADGTLTECSRITTNEIGETVLVPGHIVGWMGGTIIENADGTQSREGGQPIWQPIGSKERITLHEGEYDPESIKSMPTKDMMDATAEMMREEAQKKAEMESKYDLSRINPPSGGTTFTDISGRQITIIDKNPNDPGNGWIAKAPVLDEKGNPKKDEAGNMLEENFPITNEDYYDTMQAQLDAQEEVANIQAKSSNLSENQVKDEILLPAGENIMSPYEVPDAIAEVNPTTEPIQESNANILASESPVIYKKDKAGNDTDEVDFENMPIENSINYLNDLTGDIDATYKSVGKTLKKASEHLVSIQEKVSKIESEGVDYTDKKEVNAYNKAKLELVEAQKKVDYWNSIDEEIAASRVQPGDKTAEAILSMGEPLNGEELAAMMLGTGRLPILYDSYKKETGGRNAEARGMVGLFATKANGGLSIEEAGEQLMLADQENGTHFFDENDPNAGRNAIIDVLSGARTRGDLFGFIQRNREALAERERQAELEAYEQTIARLAEASHMTPEEFIAFEENIAQMLEERLKDIPDEELKSIFAELYLDENYGRSRESDEVGTGVPEGEGRAESNEGSPGIFSEERGDNAGASEYSEERPELDDEIRQSGDGVLPETDAVDGREEVNFVPPAQIEGENLLDYAERVVESKRVHDAGSAVDTTPTEAQKEAGNYKKGHVKIDGFDITIENPKGSVRSGVDADGKPWSITMNNTYGYIRGTEGVDGDHIDIFLGDSGNKVYVVDQLNTETGAFDEHKVMYGFNSVDEATEAYLSNYSPGWQGLGAISEVSKESFKKWIDSSHRKTKPFNEYKIAKERILSEPEYIQTQLDLAFSNRNNQAQTKEEWEYTDDGIKAYNNASDAYSSYLKHLSDSGNLQRIYDSSNIGDKIRIRENIEIAGFEVNDLVDTTKEKAEAKRKREEKKAKKSTETMRKLGLLSSELDAGVRFRETVSSEEQAIIEKAKKNGTYLKAPNGKPTNLNETQWAQVRTKAFKRWFGDWEKAVRVEKLRKSKPIKITGEEIVPSSDLKVYKKNALEYGKSLRGEYTNRDTGELVSIGKNGIKEVLHHDFKNIEQLQSVAAIPQIIEKSIYIDSMPNNDSKVDAEKFDYYVCGLNIGRVNYTVRSVFVTLKDGTRYYDHKLTKIEKGKLLDSLFGTTPGFNQETSLASEYKDTKLISLLQANSSKVVDENGEPMVVYHGSLNDFKIFEYGKIRATRRAGFYFTRNKDLAKNYQKEGKLIEAFVNLRKPLNPDETKKEITKELFLEIANKAGIERDMNKLYDIADSDIDLVEFLISANNDIKAINDALYTVTKYDGIITEDRGLGRNYIAFSPNQIKSALENVGTFSSENDDIRYREEEVQSLKTKKVSIVSSVEELADTLHTPIRIVKSAEELPEEDVARKRIENGDGIKGWFDIKSEEMAIYLPNATSVEDARESVFHEVVGHYGLRKLFGEDFNTFLDNVYANVSPEIRKQIVVRAKERGNILDLREATEEYLAALAERGFDSVEERTLWQKIKDAFIDMLRKAGVHLGFDLTDNELRYVLWKSYQNLESLSIMARAADIDMQRRLRVGNFRENEVELHYSELKKEADRLKELTGRDVNLGRNEEEIAFMMSNDGADAGTIDHVRDTFARAREEGVYYSGFFDSQTGKVYLCADQIENVNQLRGKWTHENSHLFHKSISELELEELFDKIGSKAILGVLPSHYHNLSKAEQMDEYLARATEGVVEDETSFDDIINGKGVDEALENWDFDNSVVSYIVNNLRNIFYGKEENEVSERNERKGKEHSLRSLHGKNVEAKQRDASIPGETERRFRTAESTGEERRASGKVDKSTLSLNDSAFRMSKWEKIREAYQDGMISVKLMQDYLAQKTGKAIPEWMDVYLYENSKSGRSGYRMEQFHKKLYAPLMQEAGRLMQEDRNNGSSVEEAARLFDVYMKAKHGLEERNERMRREAMLKKINSIKDEDAKSVALQEMGESGIQDIVFSDESLEKLRVNLLLKDYSGLIGLAGKDENGNDKSMPEAERYAREAISTYEANHDTKKLWELVKDVSEYALKEEYEGGLIDRETYGAIRDMYKYYIPLRGRSEKTAEDFFSYIERGASDTGFENVIKKAYGHTYESGNAFAYLAKMAETAIVQSEKNRVKQRLLWMARNYRDPSIMEIANVWYVKDSEGQWVEKVPELAGTEGEQKEAMIEFNQQMEELQKEGKAKRKLGKVDIGVPISTYQAQEHQVRVKENGREYVININADPRIARAINGYGGNEGQLKILLDGIDWTVRNLAALNTSWNPEFAVGNIIRDIEYAAGSSFVKEGIRYAAKGAKNTVPAVAAMQRYFRGKQDMSNQMDKYLQEFLENGGETGFTHLSNLNLHEKRAKKMLKRASRGKELRTGENIINQANRFVEMIPRFTTYVASRESGKSIISSVNDAKNITVNFNRRGSGRMADWETDGIVVSLATSIAPVLSRMQMFANASIQGTANYFGSAKNHPVRWASTTASVAAMGVLSAIISNMLGGDEEPGYEDIPEWVRHSNFTLFNGKNYFSLPLTMEYRPFYTLGESMAMVYLGKSDMKKAAKSVRVSMWDNWNPLSVELFKSGSPTPLLTPFYENLKDEDYKGSKITGRTSWNAYLPEYQRAKKGTGDVFMWISEGLNDVTGGNKYERGWAQVNPSQLEHLVMGWSGGTGRAVSGLYEVIKSTIAGENPELERAPIVRRFYGKVTEENRYRRLKKEFMEKVTEANNLMKSLKRMQKDYENPLDYAARINEIYKDGEYEKAYNLIEDNKTLRDYEGYYNGSETQEDADDVMKSMIDILEEALNE